MSHTIIASRTAYIITTIVLAYIGYMLLTGHI